jgi:hypothetical protein
MMVAVSSVEFDWCGCDGGGLAPPVDGFRVEIGGIITPPYA